MYFKQLKFAIALLFWLPAMLQAAPPAVDAKRIFYINSYTASEVWTEEMKRAFQGFLSRETMPRYENFELAVRFRPGKRPAPGDIKAIQANLDQRKYDLIVTSSNFAADLFLDGEVTAPAGTPILLLGYTGQIPENKRKELNLTGVWTDYQPYLDAQLCRKLLPRIDNFVLLVEGDIPPEVLDTEKWGGRLTVISGNEYTTEEMLKKIAKLPPDTMVDMDSWSSPKEDRLEISYTVLPRIKEVFHGPVFGRYDTFIDYGSWGGYIITGQNFGDLGGELALRILRGESAASIPPVKGEIRLVLDHPSLKAAHIPESLIPREAQFVNEPPEFLIQYRKELMIGAGAVILVLLYLMLHLLHRRRAQNKMNVLFSNLPVVVGIIERSGRIPYVQDAGFRGLESRIRHLDELPGELGKQVRATVREVFETGEQRELNYRDPNGTFRNIRYTRLPKDNPFHPDAVLWASQDVTELHQAHQETQAFSERLRLTLDSIGDGVIATDENERVTLINPVAAALTGYPPEEACGKTLDEIFNIISYIDGSKVGSPLKKALATRKTVELANHTDLIAKSGSRRHIADCASPIMDTDGRLSGAVLVFRDVTREYEDRDRMRMHSSVLQTAKTVAHSDYFHSDLEGNIRRPMDERFWPLRNDIPVPAKEWLAPEDLDHFRAEWKRLLTEQPDELQITYSAGPEQERRDYDMRVTKSANPINGRVEYFGLVQDVTDSRRAERQYRNNLQMLESIVENMPGYLFVKDVKDNYRYILGNRRFGELTGMDWKTIPGKFDRDVLPLDAEAAEQFHRADAELVKSGGRLDIRQYFTDSNGNRIAVRTVKSILTRSDGSQLLIGMGIDITRQCELEEQQTKTIEEMDKLSRVQEIINRSLALIVLEPDFEKAVTEMLRIIGENTGADRACIFKYTDETQRGAPIVFEWLAPGIPSLMALQTEDLPVHAAFTEQLLAGENIVVNNSASAAADHPILRERMLEMAIQSLLASGIWVDGKLWGFIVINYLSKSHDFTPSELNMVQSAAKLYQLAHERKRQLDRVADSVATQRQIVSNITIPLVMFTPEHDIITANPAMCELMGYSEPELRGRKCYEVLCRSSAPPEWCPMVPLKLDHKPRQIPFNIKGRRYQLMLQPMFDRENNLSAVLESGIDVTDLLNQQEQLEKAMNEAQAANRAKSYFLATMSHELRTPMNAVIGFSELLQNENISREEQLDYLKSINLAGTVLLNLVNDVLDLSKLEAGQGSFTLTQVDLASLLAEVVSIFRGKAEQKTLKLSYSCKDIPEILYLDTLRMRQILLNLIGNAVKFTSEGGVSVDACFLPVDAECGTLDIRINDTGIGITPEFIEKIFEPFSQEETLRGNRVYEGSGLGLAISNRLVQSMGGHIGIESQPGKGSTFGIHLEKVRFERQTNSSPAEIQAVREQTWHGRRMLLIDDVPMNLKVLQAMLKKLEISSVCVESGQEALDLLAEDRDFDLILSDLWMPQMNGVELAERIRQNPKTSGIPIFAITADSQIDKESAGKFQDILLKPVTLDGIRRLLGKHFA